MKENRRVVLGVLVCAVAVAMSLGCAMKKPCPVDELPPVAKVVEPPPAAVAKPMPAPVAGVCPVIAKEGGKILGVYAMPTGDRASSEILVETSAPAEVPVGQEFTYDIKVTNLGPCPLDQVVLYDRIPAILDMKGAVPQETGVTGDTVRWALGHLDGNQSKGVKVRAAAKRTGTIEHCARVTYIRNLCLSVLVVEPNLKLVKTAPAEVVKCDPIPVKLVVTNAGTGKAANVKVTDVLPAGLTTVDGKSEVTFSGGTLTSGQSKEFNFTAKASKTGKYENKATAVADGGLKAEAAATTVVRQPVLAITKKPHRAKIYGGQVLRYDIVVTNTGDADAKETKITDVVPAGTTFVSATDGGQLVGNMVVWNAGTLKPEGEKKVSLSVRCDKLTTLKNVAKAEAICADAVSASTTTEVKGIPAVLLEVVDLEDPIPVGEQVTYEITATNQGSAVGTNIKIVVTLEDNAQYVSSEACCDPRLRAGTLQGTNTIEFAPLPELAPKAKGMWKVTVKAMTAGDVRIAVAMTEDQLGRPVKETEATRFYE